MNQTKLQLPNGDCITLEGGDSESMAKFIHNRYLENIAPARNQPREATDTSAGNEPVLGMPSLTFTTFLEAQAHEEFTKKMKALEQNRPAGNALVISENGNVELEESCLTLPIMNFSKPGKSTTKQTSEAEPCLGLR